MAALTDRLNTLRDETLQETNSILQEIADILANGPKNPTKIYGFHVDGTESDPDQMITYLEDSVGMTPASMDYANDVFDYGSWEDAFFMPKPCILKGNGIVTKYLKPNDFSHDVDNNAVDLTKTGLASDENVMIEFPKIWLKIVPDADPKSGSVYISNRQVDVDYKDWAYISDSGEHKDFFYISAFPAVVESETFRSFSGGKPSEDLTVTEQTDYAEENMDGYYILTNAQVQLINFLTMLITKSTNIQSKIGIGMTYSNSTAHAAYVTGGKYNKGMFYGTNANTSAVADDVKIFGIESWYGFSPKRYAGDICKYDSTLEKNTILVKMCWFKEDGTDTNVYNETGEDYIDTGVEPANDWVKEMTFTQYGMYHTKTESAGSSSQYYCDKALASTAVLGYAALGLAQGGELECGPLGTLRSLAASSTSVGTITYLTYI